MLYRPVFDALNAADVRFVTVGGFAVLLHGVLRVTADLDLMIDLDPPAARRAVDALSGIDLIPRAPVDAVAFADPETRRSWIEDKGMVVFTMWHPADARLSVDLFVSHPMDFERAWRDAITVDVGGTLVRVASIEDLITMKSAVARPQDLADVELLQGLRGGTGDG